MDEELEKILYDKFTAELAKGELRTKLSAKIGRGAATYQDAAHYANAVGDVCLDYIKKWTGRAKYKGEVIPYGDAQRVIVRFLGLSYDDVSAVTVDLQAKLNELANVGLAAKKAKFDADAAYNLARKAAEISETEGADAAERFLERTVSNHVSKTVDRTMEANADLQKRAGLEPIIIRHAVPGCCEWCTRIAGHYDYNDLPDDFWGRHLDCRCVFDYRPGDGRREIVHNERRRIGKY